MRIPVEMRRAYKLLNHGPTVLVGAASGGRSNVMAAAWAMALDFEPPKVAVVVAAETFTRKLIDATGVFTLSIPTVAQVDLTYAVGTISGADTDKLAELAVKTFPATEIEGPLVEGCVGWLECRAANEPHIAEAYDLFIGEVVAAWADDEVWKNGTWAFTRDDHRTIHHVAGGSFFATGAMVSAKK